MAKRNKLRRSSSRKSNLGKNFLLTLMALTITAVAVLVYILFETEHPEVSLQTTPRVIGAKLALPLKAADHRSGLRYLRVFLKQDDKEAILLDRMFPRQSWLKKAGPERFEEVVAADIAALGFKDGEAELVAVGNDFSLMGFLRGNSTEKRATVSIDTKPPRVTVEHAQLYIQGGGSGIVLYSISEDSRQHGVRIDNHSFPGFSLSEGSQTKIAYIGLPWDSKRPEKTGVFAVDEAGNEGFTPFVMHFKPAREKKDRIAISDGFLNKKMPELSSHITGTQDSLIKTFLYANQQVRRQNADKIKEICANPAPDRMWQDRFLRMPGATRAGFADQRTYTYQGQVVDHQTHLGIDLASTARAEVRAANHGKVIFADYLGIYGNMIVIDHGQGIFSLYSHLSSMTKHPGDMVKKDEQIGRTGSSGMAGGDHLHFSMLIHGIFVTPIEWWDQHWIDANITDILNDHRL
ncbi:MAG: peptidase M23 [Desulfobulbus propionicus]|nr:MAG: peptidase M23 [Desulfobulbus propionicus]